MHIHVHSTMHVQVEPYLFPAQTPWASWPQLSWHWAPYLEPGEWGWAGTLMQTSHMICDHQAKISHIVSHTYMHESACVCVFGVASIQNCTQVFTHIPPLHAELLELLAPYPCQSMNSCPLVLSTTDSFLWSLMAKQQQLTCILVWCYLQAYKQAHAGRGASYYFSSIYNYRVTLWGRQLFVLQN